MVSLITFNTLLVVFALSGGFIVYLLQCLYLEQKRHTMAMDALDEARRLQVAAISSEVSKRDAQIVKLKTTNSILQNDRELAHDRANQHDGARRAANKLVEVRTRKMQRQAIEIRNLKERQGAVTARIKAVKAAAGSESGRLHALGEQMTREGSPFASYVKNAATAAKNTRQAARNLEVFAS
jgi:hypothetical protein